MRITSNSVCRKITSTPVPPAIVEVTIGKHVTIVTDRPSIQWSLVESDGGADVPGGDAAGRDAGLQPPPHVQHGPGPHHQRSHRFQVRVSLVTYARFLFRLSVTPSSCFARVVFRQSVTPGLCLASQLRQVRVSPSHLRQVRVSPQSLTPGSCFAGQFF